MEKVSYGLHVAVWLLATTAAILVSIAAYRDDAIIQSESLSQYSEYGVTCGITATWQQSQKIDGTHTNKLTLHNAVDDCKYKDIQHNILTATVDEEEPFKALMEDYADSGVRSRRMTKQSRIVYSNAETNTAKDQWTATHAAEYNNVCMNGWATADRTAWKEERRTKYLGVVGVTDLKCDTVADPTIALTETRCAQLVDHVYTNNRNARLFGVPDYFPTGQKKSNDFAGPMFVHTSVPIRSGVHYEATRREVNEFLTGFETGPALVMRHRKSATNLTKYARVCVGLRSQSDVDAARNIFGESAVKSVATKIKGLSATDTAKFERALTAPDNACWGLDGVASRQTLPAGFVFGASYDCGGDGLFTPSEFEIHTPFNRKPNVLDGDTTVLNAGDALEKNDGLCKGTVNKNGKTTSATLYNCIAALTSDTTPTTCAKVVASGAATTTTTITTIGAPPPPPPPPPSDYKIIGAGSKCSNFADFVPLTAVQCDAYVAASSSSPPTYSETTLQTESGCIIRASAATWAPGSGSTEIDCPSDAAVGCICIKSVRQRFARSSPEAADLSSDYDMLTGEPTEYFSGAFGKTVGFGSGNRRLTTASIMDVCVSASLTRPAVENAIIVERASRYIEATLALDVQSANPLRGMGARAGPRRARRAGDATGPTISETNAEFMLRVIDDAIKPQYDKIMAVAPLAVLAKWDHGDKLLETAWESILETYQTVVNQGNTYHSGSCDVMPTGDVFTQAQRVNEFYDTAGTYSGLMCSRQSLDLPLGFDGEGNDGINFDGLYTSYCVTSDSLFGKFDIGFGGGLPIGATELLPLGDHLLTMLTSSMTMPTASLHSVRNARMRSQTCAQKCKVVQSLGAMTLLIGGFAFIFLTILLMPSMGVLFLDTAKNTASESKGGRCGSNIVLVVVLACLFMLVAFMTVSTIYQGDTYTMEECGFTSLAAGLGELPMSPTLAGNPEDLAFTTFTYESTALGVAGKLRAAAIAVVVLVAAMLIVLSVRGQKDSEYAFGRVLNMF